MLFICGISHIALNQLMHIIRKVKIKIEGFWRDYSIDFLFNRSTIVYFLKLKCNDRILFPI